MSMQLIYIIIIKCVNVLIVPDPRPGTASNLAIPAFRRTTYDEQLTALPLFF